MIEVVNVKTSRYNVYIGRGTPLGNPYPMSYKHSRDEVCDDYASYLKLKLAQRDKPIMKALESMVDRLETGEYLMIACHCAPLRCHGDTVKEVLEEMYNDRNKIFTPIFRYSIHSGYEVSSKGDKRFSALFAVMPDGRTLEAHYQCDSKAFNPGGTNWRDYKGKPPAVRMTEIELYEKYLNLWKIWAKGHPDWMEELRQHAIYNGYVLRDSFARTKINQARALSQILSEMETNEEYFT